MSEPTPDADIVRIPGQGNGPPSTRSTGRARAQRAAPADSSPYRPRHRADRTQAHVPAVATVSSLAEHTVDVAPIPRQGRRVYATPAWVPSAAAPPQVDAGATARRAEPAAVSFIRPEGLLSHGRWRAPRRGRLAVMLLLVAFLSAAVATGTGAVQRQTTPTLALALSCLLGAAGMFAVLAVLRPTVVELDEVWLSVRGGAHHDRFDLTNPFQELGVTGTAGTSRWRLGLGCPDGRVVTITGSMVDSRRLDPVVRYAQQYADRDRTARGERFSR
jgi:hypothetical protein